MEIVLQQCSEVRDMLMKSVNGTHGKHTTVRAIKPVVMRLESCTFAVHAAVNYTVRLSRNVIAGKSPNCGVLERFRKKVKHFRWKIFMLYGQTFVDKRGSSPNCTQLYMLSLYALVL